MIKAFIKRLKYLFQIIIYTIAVASGLLLVKILTEGVPGAIKTGNWDFITPFVVVAAILMITFWIYNKLS
jgi:hypothetical protein